MADSIYLPLAKTAVRCARR